MILFAKGYSSTKKVLLARTRTSCASFLCIYKNSFYRMISVQELTAHATTTAQSTTTNNNKNNIRNHEQQTHLQATSHHTINDALSLQLQPPIKAKSLHPSYLPTMSTPPSWKPSSVCKGVTSAQIYRCVQTSKIEIQHHLAPSASSAILLCLPWPGLSA